ncbi:hypothetical protein STIAU_5450 [Stigmatella aurantiaca DW4/3-1]|uniref:Uncharacterized protein n=1 Tax=Stigmatella aurantiaca (strain DW4/3-1) TaxID=378806 RepID=Q08WQ3_STIAD|nr:hypothetical protein STIAU_5450 [Stigmatella aurantiaca DW4/3-1]
MAPQLRLEPIQRLGHAQLGAENNPVGLLDAADLLRAKAVPLQPHGVEPGQLRPVSLRHAVRGNVHHHHGAARDEGMLAHPRELMHRRQPREDDVVLDQHVPSDRGALPQDATVAHHAVMRHVAVAHEEVAVADAGDAAATGRADVQRGELANLVLVTEDEFGVLALVLQILGGTAQGGELEHPVARAERRAALDDSVRPHARLRTNLHLGSNDRECANLHRLVELRIRVDYRGGVNLSHAVSLLPSRQLGRRLRRGPRILVHHRGQELAFRDLHAVHRGRPLRLPDRALVAQHFNAQFQPIPGKHRLAELRVVYPHQVGNLVLRVHALALVGQDGRGLRQRLQDEHPWHHRVSREVAVEKGLIDGDVLVGRELLALDELHHPVYQQKRVAMGQQPLDLSNVHHPPFSFSSMSTLRRRARTSLSRSPNWPAAAEARNHSRWGIAGDPETIWPSSTSCATPDWAPTLARSPTRIWPTTPTCPASTTPVPTSAEPETPACAQMSVSGPIFTLWASCTRLSSFVPRPTTVSPMVALSMHVQAPTSTSSSMRTMPVWGILKCCGPLSPSASKAKPKPSAPTTHEAWRMTREPTWHRSRTVTLG